MSWLNLCQWSNYDGFGAKSNDTKPQQQTTKREQYTRLKASHLQPHFAIRQVEYLKIPTRHINAVS